MRPTVRSTTRPTAARFGTWSAQCRIVRAAAGRQRKHAALFQAERRLQRSGFDVITFRLGPDCRYGRLDLRHFVDGVGGSTAFSAISDVAGITVSPVNDAPVLDSSKSSALLPRLMRMLRRRVGRGRHAGVEPGGLSWAVVATTTVTDADSGALLGIALSGTNSANGTWYYFDQQRLELDPGRFCLETSALLLNADSSTRLYFKPAARLQRLDQRCDHVPCLGPHLRHRKPEGRCLDNGNTTAFSSATDTASITVNPVNDAPVLNANGGGLTYTQGQAASPVNSALTLSDIDSPNLSSATVSITANFQSGVDVLGFTSQHGITGSFNSTTGALTLTGSASVADYQDALRSVTYSNSSATSGPASRAPSRSRPMMARPTAIASPARFALIQGDTTAPALTASYANSLITGTAFDNMLRNGDFGRRRCRATATSIRRKAASRCRLDLRHRVQPVLHRVRHAV